MMMGSDPAGSATSASAARHIGPYVLWSAGDDGLWWMDANGKTDDVTNFDLSGVRFK